MEEPEIPEQLESLELAAFEMAESPKVMGRGKPEETGKSAYTLSLLCSLITSLLHAAENSGTGYSLQIV